MRRPSWQVRGRFLAPHFAAVKKRGGTRSLSRAGVLGHHAAPVKSDVDMVQTKQRFSPWSSRRSTGWRGKTRQARCRRAASVLSFVTVLSIGKRFMRSAILAGLLVGTFFVGTATADPVADAIKAAQQGDYATALRQLNPLAAGGNPAAEFALGLLYDTGRGVMQNSIEAANWYRRAADQGFAEAENNLGALYSNGEGVPHDHAEAMRWWRLAADQGLPTAQSNLADLYANGDGVPMDLVQAFKWSSLAANQGEPRASDILSQVSMQMTPDQITQAQQLIRLWQPAGSQHI
jgi:TPR repeat protein